MYFKQRLLRLFKSNAGKLCSKDFLAKSLGSYAKNQDLNSVLSRLVGDQVLVTFGSKYMFCTDSWKRNRIRRRNLVYSAVMLLHSLGRFCPEPVLLKLLNTNELPVEFYWLCENGYIDRRPCTVLNKYASDFKMVTAYKLSERSYR